MINTYQRTITVNYLFVPMLLLFMSLSILSCTSEPEEKHLIGIINLNPKLSAMVDGFKEGMTEQGYVEGKNITYRHLKNYKDIDTCLQDLKNEKADLIMTVSTPAAKKALEACRESGIPVVAICFDPVRGGIVDSLVYKEENVTGIKVGESVQKALEWLLLIAPDTKRVFTPVNFDTTAAALSLNDLKEAAEKLSVDLSVTQVKTPGELREALASMPDDIDAIFILHSLLVVKNLDTVLKTALERKLPTVSGSGLYKKGVTISYGQEHRQTGKQLSELAYMILNGYPASDLPFKTADFFLGIHLENAKKIGLEIPENILKQARIIRSDKIQ